MTISDTNPFKGLADDVYEIVRSYEDEPPGIIESVKCQLDDYIWVCQIDYREGTVANEVKWMIDLVHLEGWEEDWDEVY